MKKQTLIAPFFIFILTTFSGCTVVEGIFKTGMGVGIFIVLFIIVIIIFFVSRISKTITL